MSLNKKIGFKLLSGIVLLTMFLSILSPILFYPEPAQAQFTDVGHIAMQIGKWVWERVNDLLKYAWKVGGAVAYKNALNVYLGQMAQQSAEYVASGGKGQKPLFLTDPQYWKKAGDEALGEFIDKTAQASGFINQSLCDPLDPQLKFKLILSLPDISSKMPPISQNKLCSLSKIRKAQGDLLKKNLVSFSADTETGDEFGARLEQLNQLYNADTSINQTTRYVIDCFKTDINNSFNRITGYLDDINQKWPDISVIANEGLLNKLKVENKKLQDLPNKTTCFTNNNMDDPVSCSIASVNDFCGNPKCRGYCNEGLTGCDTIGTDCTLKYANCCKAQTNRAQTYFSQLLSQITEINGRVTKFIAGVESPSYAGGGPNTTLEDLQKDMSASGSDLGALMVLSEQAQLEKAAREEEKKVWGLINGPMKGIESLVSGKIKTPSTLVGEQARKAVQEGTASVKQYTGVAAADAIGIFTNTLISKLLDRLKKGLNPSEDPDTSWSIDPSGKVVFNPGATESKIAMADLATAPIRSGGQVDLLENYSSYIDRANYVLPDTNVIDAGFRRAIEEKMSISEAIEKNLLNKNWTVGEIGKADRFNDCNERFSLTNIKKLRRARITPLGLEIAATKISNGELGNKNYTLKEVVDGFNQENSPFHRLVDPNWILSIPQFFCEARGYGAVPLGDSNQRQEVCVDLKDCLKTDEKGQCLGWGYCTREKNIWRFGGDECSKQYESCSIYKNVNTGEEKSFVKNTIDFSGCDQNNVGCGWYCKNYGPEVVDNKEILTWTCSGPEVVGNQSNVIFFNKNISACSNDNEGCHEYIQATVGSGVNLIPNGSFENYNVDNQGQLTSVNGWDIEGGFFLADQNLAYSGKAVAKVISAWGSPRINPDVSLPLAIGKQYTFSIWVRPEKSINLHLFANPVDSSNVVEISQQKITNNWQRLIYTFNYPLIINGSELDVRTLRWEPGDDINGDIYFDDFQLESGANTTPYKEYASINKIYLKTAPDYLKCGTINEDPVKCANFTKKCSATEVGCELYTNISSGSAFPAIVKNEDTCPSDCVGYNTFRQSATNFESAVPFTNFISATGKSCPASDVGCEEFTNLDEVAKGGEGKEYYSYLRQCVRTDQNNNPVAIGQVVCNPYYTWIGSDTTGYQLKRYYLKQGNDAGPAVVSNLRLDLGSCAGADDILVNPHCKQFYSATGEVYYRIYENTISCSQDCHPFRKTTSVDNAYCPTNDVPGTSYDPATGICVYMAIPSEGVSCGKANVGCREYKGNNANNMKTLFNDQFETADNSITLWTGDVLQSTESIKLGGHSMRVLSTNSVSRVVKNSVKKDKSYLITFWVKGSGTYSAKFGSDLSFGSKNIASDEWQEVKLGPVNFSRDVDINESLFIAGPSTGFYLDNIKLQEITSNIYLVKNSWKTPLVCDRDYNNNSAPGFMIGCDSYKDRAGKFSYLKSFSSLCPDDKVGCDLVIDTHNSSSPFGQEFNKDTAVLTDDVNVPADSVDYLVIDSRKICKAEFKGCERFGLPTLDINGAVVGWSDQYLKNDPDLYDRRPILCDQNGQGCEEFFDASSKSKAYFRDPKNKLCEYRENVNIGSEVKSGWFKKGTNQACYYNTEEGPNKGNPYQPDGLTYGIRWAGESNYDNWVGVCPSSQNSCASFVDTQATAVLNLVKNGSFEDSLTLTSPWYDATNYDFVDKGSITVGITQEGENKLLSIDSRNASFVTNAPSGVSWFAAAVTQQIKPSISLPGSNYVIKAKIKVDNLLTPIGLNNSEIPNRKSIAHLSVDLNFEGMSGVPAYYKDDGITVSDAFTTGEWQDWAACYKWDNGKWKGIDIINRDGSSGSNGILDCIDRLPAPNDIPPCSYDPATLTNSEVPLAKCLDSLSAGFDVINIPNGWAWVITHGYWTNASISVIYQGDSTMIDGRWHDFSQVIAAAGPLNPRSLKIKEAVVNFRIIDQAYAADTMGRGIASLDDVEIKSLEPYYYLNNTKLDRTSCNGQVSPKAGCILFADSSLKDYHNGTTPFTYNSVATYKKSEEKKYDLVMPVDCKKTLDCEISNNQDADYCKYCARYSQSGNDANAIIKVVRDRECGEWLTCAGSTPQWSKTENIFKNVCDYVLRCDQLSDNAAISCAHPVVTNNPDILNEAEYKARDVSWAGRDYSGYSLYNYYPVENLAPKLYREHNENIYKLTSSLRGELRCISGKTSLIGESCATNADCGSGSCVGTTCSAGNSAPISTAGNTCNIDADCIGTNGLGQGNCEYPAGTSWTCSSGSRQYVSNTTGCSINADCGAGGICLPPAACCGFCVEGGAGSSGNTSMRLKNNNDFSIATKDFRMALFWCGYGCSSTCPEGMSCDTSTCAKLCDGNGYIDLSGNSCTDSLQCGNGVCQANTAKICSANSYKKDSYEGSPCASNTDCGVENAACAFKCNIDSKIDNFGGFCDVKGSNALQCGLLDDGTPGECSDDAGVDGRGRVIDKTCRLYPEIDSPFAPGLSDKYKGINICQPIDDNNTQSYLYRDCQCAYKKGEYSGTVNYLTYIEDQWLGICSAEGQCGDAKLGEECAPSQDPYNSGCTRLSKKTTAIGQRGYCLERDLSVPGELNSCLTWWPGSAAVGDPDIYNQYQSAGYYTNISVWYSAFGASTAQNISSGLQFTLDGSNSYGVCGRPDANILGYYEVDNYGVVSWVNNNDIPIYFDQIDQVSLYFQEWGGNYGKTVCGDDSGGGDDEITGSGWVNLNISNNFDLTQPSGNCSDGNNFVGVSAGADSGGRLRIGIQLCDNSEHTGTTSISQIIVSIKNGASYVAKIADANNFTKAWTNRLKGYETTAIIDDAFYATICLPYGSSGSPKPSTLIVSGTICDNRHGFVYTSKDSLKNLFAKSYEAYSFNTTTRQYSNGAQLWSPDDSQLSLSVTGHSAPKVASVKCTGGELSGEGSCSLGAIGKITINNEDTNNLTGSGSIYPAVLKFYAWADKNHMPIREVMVDWDDGKPLSSGSNTMLAKNHKPMCCSSNADCLNLGISQNDEVYQRDGTSYLNFGNVPNACTPTYFQFNHLYHCEGPAQCSFKPTVYVKDNWGWCNGGNHVGDDNCCEDSNSSDNKCDVRSNGTSFSGSILLKP